MDLANTILEFGTTIALILVCAFAVGVLWKYLTEERTKHDTAQKEREEKYITTISNFSKSMDNFSATLTSIDSRMGNLENKVDKIETEIENIKD